MTDRSTHDAAGHKLALAPTVGDEVKTSTCYMCACRCGIRVYKKDGAIRFIEGNPDHPVNRGVLCAKGSAGAMQHYSPARLHKPLLRIGPRGSGEFKEIEWDEALTLAADWLGHIRDSEPRRLAFFTGRDQSQSFTGWWAQQFGTVNFAAHGGFCSVNMAAAGLYTVGGSFWEFGEPDWEHTRYLLMFGVAEDHDSNPIKMGLGKIKARAGTRFVSVNPVRTGYSAIADEWVGIRPGTDGLFVAALIHELLRAERVDWTFLARYTNAGWLVIDAPGSDEHGLFARDAAGRPLSKDATGVLRPAGRADGDVCLVGACTLADGRRATPAFELLAQRFLAPDYAPAAVADQTGVPVTQIRRIAAELASAAFDDPWQIDSPWTDTAGRKHAGFAARPVSMHAMRGISAHANGFHTCRLIHVLQMLLGAIDTPGGFRYKAPFPKHMPGGKPPAADPAAAATPLVGMPLGFPMRPEDLLCDETGAPERIDKAFSWEHPLAIHGLMHTVLHNAWAGDPYPIDTVFLYMSNIAWNSAMNIGETLHYLTDQDAQGGYRIPHVIYSDAYYSETVPYADLVLPDTTYLERWDCISLLDRPISSSEGPADAIRQPVVAPDRDVRPFQDVLLDLGVRLGLPGFVNDEGAPTYPGGYADYMVNHQRSPGIGPLAGWRGSQGNEHGCGAPYQDQLQRYIDNGCFWRYELPLEQQYYRFANQGYLDYAKSAGFVASAEPITLELYSETLQRFRLAAQGHGARQPPPVLRPRIARYFDPLPTWYPPNEVTGKSDNYPLHVITQRPMHIYHSWGAQNAWLRQITARNFLYMHHDTAARLDVGDGDWVWLVNDVGRVKAPVRCMSGCNPDTVWTWNAIGKRRGTAGLADDVPEATQGFLVNHLIRDLMPAAADDLRYANADPVTGQAAWFDLTVRIEKCSADEYGETDPMLPSLHGDRQLSAAPRFEVDLKGKPTAHIASVHREFVGARDSGRERRATPNKGESK